MTANRATTARRPSADSGPAHPRPSNPPVLRSLVEDARELAKVKGNVHTGAAGVLDVLGLPGFWSVVLWRVGNALHDHGNPLARLVYFANLVLFGADLAPGAVVGAGCVMPHPVGVGIAGDVVIGERCHIMGLVRIGGSGQGGKPGHAVIGDDTWFMDGCKVLGPVHIGDRSLVGAAALLKRDVPADMVVLGPRGAGEAQIRPRAQVLGEASEAPLSDDATERLRAAS